MPLRAGSQGGQLFLNFKAPLRLLRLSEGLYHLEQAVKVANFSEIGRLKELMKRTDMDIARVSQVLMFEALSYYKP